MINVCQNTGQADCHLIEFPDGRQVLIDVGEGHDAGNVLLPYLKKHKVKHLSLIVISHFHRDHYGKLLDLLKAGIQIDRVVGNVPAARAIADAERPWGCDWDDVQSVLRTLAEHQIPYSTPKAGERLLEANREGVTTALEVVCLFDGVNTPVGRTDVNDTSILVRLSHGATRALFTGDLNAPLGAWLAQSDFDLKADVLKLPHHGTEGSAPNAFFERVGPKAALVPSPKDLWYSDRSKRSRQWCAEHQVPAYVSGLCGTVTVEFGRDGFRINSEHPMP